MTAKRNVTGSSIPRGGTRYPTKDEIITATSKRLDVVCRVLDMDTVEDFAQFVGATRSQASNWLNGYHLIPVDFVGVLKAKTGITSDWLYYGDPKGLTPSANIHLMAESEGIPLGNPPPEPAPASPSAVPARRRSDAPRKKGPPKKSASASASVAPEVERRKVYLAD